MWRLNLAKREPAAFYALATTVVSLAVGPGNVLFVTCFFSPHVQGYFYTFGSLGALQFFLDLGLTQVLVHFASHEWAHIRENSGRIELSTSDSHSISRLVSLAKLSATWFRVGSLILFVVLAFGGGVFFERQGELGVNWCWPGVVFTFALAFNFSLTPYYALLQGCGKVEQYWKYRLLQQVVNALSLWVCIVSGAGLWSRSCAAITCSVLSLVFISRFRDVVDLRKWSMLGPAFSWRRDVWPLQWRVSISWFCGFLPTIMYVPIFFHYFGPVIAGKMGVTVAVGNMVIALGAIWTSSRSPVFSEYASKGDYRSGKRLFRETVLITAFTAFGAFAAVVLGVWLLKVMNLRIYERLLPVQALGVYCLAVCLKPIINVILVYFRAHKEEPLYGLFGISTLALLVASICCAKELGYFGLIILFCLVVYVIEFPLAIVAYVRRDQGCDRALGV